MRRYFIACGEGGRKDWASMGNVGGRRAGIWGPEVWGWDEDRGGVGRHEMEEGADDG